MLLLLKYSCLTTDGDTNNILFSGRRTPPNILQKVSVEVIGQDTCQEWLKIAGRKETVYDTMVCAGYKEGGKDSCQVRKKK